MPYYKVKIIKNVKRKRDKAKGLKAISYKSAAFSFSALAVVAAVSVLFYIFYFKSPYFIVENMSFVGKAPNSTVNYGELERMITGRNTFALKLSDIRKYMLKKYPELFELRLTRAFPNSVIAKMIMRKPVAQIYDENYYPVDKDCVILSGSKGTPEGGLPVISGVSSQISKQAGTKTDSRQVGKALELLKEINLSGILEEHKLVEIDISNLRNAIFFLENGLEIKIGYEEYASRLNNLKAVLRDPKIRPADIRYIDLRFKEPVIGPKWKK